MKTKIIDILYGVFIFIAVSLLSVLVIVELFNISRIGGIIGIIGGFILLTLFSMVISLSIMAPSNKYKE